MAASTRTTTTRAKKTAPVVDDEITEDLGVDPGSTADDLGDDIELGFGEPVQHGDTEEVPEDLSFSSNTGEDAAVERIKIKIDGQDFYLYKPSNSLIYMLAGTLATGSDITERLNAMLQLVQVCLDDVGVMYLRRRMADRRNNFDDGLLGRLTGVILDKWGNPDTAQKFAQQEKSQQGNRATRRQAARKK